MNLKELAGQIVKESDYSLDAKKQLFNFISEEANEVQLKSFILDEKIMKLDIDSEKIVNERFEIFKEKEIKDLISFAREELPDILKEKCYDSKTIDFVINEATDYQILSLIFTDVLPKEKSNPIKEKSLNELARNVIEGKVELINEEIGTLGKAAIATLLFGPFGLATYGIYKIYQRYMTKAGRLCRKAVDRRACRKQYKINAIKAQINSLKSLTSKCNKAKNPEKCKQRIEKKINMLTTRLAGTAATSKQRAIEN